MILAFDIGGSRIRAGLWDGHVLERLGEAETPARSLDAFAAVVGGYAAGRTLKGLALSVPGVVDPETGTGKVANIPCIDGLALGPELAERLGLPVLVLNDADCFALAEARRGAGRGHRNVFGIILGTGVGGGLVIDGRLVTGAGGHAGEWGHGPVVCEPWALPCGCGQVGCLDTIGGARGMERLHLARTGESLHTREIVGRWRDGEPAASATMELWRDLVSGPLAMVVNTVGATAVPVGGGLSNDAALIGWLDQAVRDRVLRRPEGALVVPAVCGADAGILGAAQAGEQAWGG
ncbi:ROK family protein [Rhodobacter sp. Har01]|uniref:ROK family protein n=1 Tax=Rhodobacter sp. Har01 TaxID=2883999 RepID=UPI001D07B8FA|nr:ROK family protein [Rhodobacter sp. Har01]MCB6178144.1 ROK family protein [Rhodobacter sp. Har01]